MSRMKQIEQLLKVNRMKLVRSKKHLVYRHPDGRSFTISASPSDVCAENNILRELKRFLGLQERGESKETPRIKRERIIEHEPHKESWSGGKGEAGKPLAAQLQMAVGTISAVYRLRLREKLLNAWRGSRLEVRELSRMEKA